MRYSATRYIPTLTLTSQHFRNSTKYVSWKERKMLCAHLKTIYGSKTLEEAGLSLHAFEEIWDDKYPTVSQLWHRHWDNIIPFFAYPSEIRKVIDTANAIKSLNRSLRKVLKTKGSFPSDESIMKLLYLAMHNISKKWTMAIQNWGRLSISFPLNLRPEFRYNKWPEYRYGL